MESHPGYLPYPPPKAFFGLLVGARNSGKTTLLANLLTRDDFFKGRYDEVYLVSPTVKHDPTYSVVDVPPSQVCDHWDPKFVEAIYDRQAALPRERMKDILVIIDDCVSEPSFKDNSGSGILGRLAVRGRHVRISVLLTTQKLTLVPTVCRVNADWVVLFRTTNKIEAKAQREEYSYSCPLAMRFIVLNLQTFKVFDEHFKPIDLK